MNEAPQGLHGLQRFLSNLVTYIFDFLTDTSYYISVKHTYL